MSKRYGRTQKNRHRAMIVAQEETLSALGDLVVRLEKQATHWRKRYQEVKTRVTNYARYSALLDPECEVSRMMPGYWKIAELKPLPMAFDPTAEVPIEAPHHLVLELIEVMGSFDQLGRNVHIGINTPDGRFAYAVSEQEWQYGPTDHFVKFISQRITEEFVAIIKSERMRRVPNHKHRD